MGNQDNRMRVWPWKAGKEDGDSYADSGEWRGIERPWQ